MTVHQRQALLVRMLMFVQRRCPLALKACQSLPSQRLVVTVRRMQVRRMQVSAGQMLTAGRMWYRWRAATVGQMLYFHPPYRTLTWCRWVARAPRSHLRR